MNPVRRYRRWCHQRELRRYLKSIGEVELNRIISTEGRAYFGQSDKPVRLSGEEVADAANHELRMRRLKERMHRKE